MKQPDLVANWLSSVAYSHSQSKATDGQYKRLFTEFSSLIGKSAQEIQADYEASDDRIFGRKYAQYIIGWITYLTQEKNLAPDSIKTMVGAIKSFFKYNNLPLAFVPQARGGIVYHNRDITKEEIVQIMAQSKPREKAFFAVMAQSGLRPHTIGLLKIKNLESFDKIPCKIDVPKEITKGKYGSYVTFIGSDAIKYMRQYFATRTDLTPDSLVFCSHNDLTRPVDVKDVSRAFRLAARKLEKSGAIHYEIRERKPSELRLYTLRKFFRKYANQMGFEHVNYVMGHTTRGSDSNYTPKDPEFYRDLYEQKAMPFLRLETATPIESEKQIQELRQHLQSKTEQLTTLEMKVKKLEPLVELIEKENPENLRLFVKAWLETEDFHKEQQAKEEGKPYKRKIELELTEEQADKIKKLSNSLNIDIAKAIQKALNLTIEDLTKNKEIQ